MCFDLVRKEGFDIFITILILINTIIMGAYYYGAPLAYSRTLDYMSETLAWIFTVEMLMKMFGLGLKQYFRESWNIFDFIVTIGADVGYILMDIYHQHYGILLVVSINIFIN